MDQFQAAFDRLKKQLGKAQSNVEARKGECINCRWYKPVGELTMTDALCRAPLVSEFSANDEDGSLSARHPVLKYWHRQEAQMNIPSLCGPERRLWTRKLNWFEKLMGWLS